MNILKRRFKTILGSLIIIVPIVLSLWGNITNEGWGYLSKVFVEAFGLSFSFLILFIGITLIIEGMEGEDEK